MERKCWIAAVGPVAGPPRTRHAVGLPDGPQHLLPFPQLLVIESSSEGVYLFRYTFDGEDCGDTWHESVGDAREQAAFEYEAALGPWYEVPDSAADALQYAFSVGMLSRSEV